MDKYADKHPEVLSRGGWKRDPKDGSLVIGSDSEEEEEELDSGMESAFEDPGLEEVEAHIE